MQNYNIERVFSICVRFDSSLLFVGLECQINFDRFTVSHFHEFKDFFSLPCRIYYKENAQPIFLIRVVRNVYLFDT